MKRTPLLLFTFLASLTLCAQDPSEIFLFDLAVKKDKVIISKPVNITNRKGYDNQPSFHPDSPIIYYSSMDASGRTDIISYDYRTKTTKPLTQTPEKEYSPTVTLDKTYISCIIQRDNGAQDLGKYPVEGGQADVIINNLTVGYHVWADNSHLGLFVLGTPNTLHYVRLPTKKDTIIAENIGRSLHRVPNETAISFVRKAGPEEWFIEKLNTHTMKVARIGPAITNREDFCWLPEGRLLMSDGPKIYFAQPSENWSGWTEVTVESGKDVLRNATRLAASADGKKLAVVVAE